MSRYNFDEEARQTDEELAGDLKKLGALPEDRIKELLPERTDQEQLKALIATVNAATSENQKKAVLYERLGQVSEVVKGVVKMAIKAAI